MKKDKFYESNDLMFSVTRMGDGFGFSIYNTLTGEGYANSGLTREQMIAVITDGKSGLWRKTMWVINPCGKGLLVGFTPDITTNSSRYFELSIQRVWTLIRWINSF